MDEGVGPCSVALVMLGVDNKKKCQELEWAHWRLFLICHCLFQRSSLFSWESLATICVYVLAGLTLGKRTSCLTSNIAWKLWE